MQRAIPSSLLILVLSLGACDSAGLNTSTTHPDTHRLQGPGVADGRYDCDIDTLGAIMPKVFADLHWGLGALSNDVTAMRATGITGNDSPVEIRAQQVDVNQVAVQVSVGRFTDEQSQQQFYRALAARLEAIKK